MVSSIRNTSIYDDTNSSNSDDDGTKQREAVNKYFKSGYVLNALSVTAFRVRDQKIYRFILFSDF